MKTTQFDAAAYLTDDETIYHYLTDELESKESFYMADALGTVARALGGFPQLSHKTGVSEHELMAASDTEHLDEALVVNVLESVAMKFSPSIAA